MGLGTAWVWERLKWAKRMPVPGLAPGLSLSEAPPAPPLPALIALPGPERDPAPPEAAATPQVPPHLFRLGSQGGLGLAPLSPGRS